MEFLIIISFAICGVAAYYFNKINIRYAIKIAINIVSLLVSFIILCLIDITSTSMLIYVIIFFFTVLGVAVHFIIPLLLNSIAKIVSKATQQSYTRKSYRELLLDGHRMYFAVLLYTTIKFELYVLMIISFYYVL